MYLHLAYWTLSFAYLPGALSVCLVPFDDNFDDLTPNPISGLLSVPGTYNGLQYEDWNDVAVDTSSLTGSLRAVAPHSPKNYLATGLVPDLVLGGDLELTPVAYVSVNSTETTSFDLESFYFACAEVTYTTVASFSLACHIYVCPTALDGSELACADFYYEPESLFLAPMSLATLPSGFERLTKVVFAIDQTQLGLVSNIAANLLVDDVTHCNH